MLFFLQGTDMETVVQYSSELCIPKHRSCHNDLAPFSDLMKWLKEVDQTVFLELCQVLIISALAPRAAFKQKSRGLERAAVIEHSVLEYGIRIQNAGMHGCEFADHLGMQGILFLLNNLSTLKYEFRVKYTTNKCIKQKPHLSHANLCS